MATTPLRALTYKIATGGTAVLVQTNGHGGGFIINPASNKDQKIAAAEPLVVSLIGPPASALRGSGPNAKLLALGHAFYVPPYTSVWANAKTSGHAFTAFFAASPPPPYPPAPVPGNFPPTGPTGRTIGLWSYLYQEYSDDADLQAFVAAYNAMQQDYVDTFNALNLPIYSGDIIAGALMDWVGQGIYGYKRPTLYQLAKRPIGPLNTWGPNPIKGAAPPIAGSGPLPLSTLYWPPASGVIVANDDLYKRCLTWHYNKGDGKYFDVTWLKRRVMRFCIGYAGTSPPIDDTGQISVSFRSDWRGAIRFVHRQRAITAGPLNTYGPGGFSGPFGKPRANPPITPNGVGSTTVDYNPLPHENQFALAVQTGALELPFQWQWTVTIG